MRIVSKLQQGDTEHSLDEVASSLGFNSWEIGYNAIKSMQDSRIYFVSKFQGLLVIDEYSEFGFDEVTGHGYQFKRYLGEQIAQIMGEIDQDNKWIQDQIMEYEVADVYLSFKKSFNSLY